VSEIYDRAAQRAQAQAAGKPLESLRIRTHLADLDPLLKGGLLPGGLYVVAGRPGQGKSSLLQTINHNASTCDRKTVLAMSAEMSNREVAGRALSIETGLQAEVFLEKVPAQGDWEKFTAAMEKYSSAGRVLLLDAPGMTIARLRSKALRVKARFGLDLLTVDYLQLMRAGVRMQNREQEVAYISRELKILAGELEAPVLAAAQLSRAVEQRSEKRPQLSDLRESGAIENDADAVMFIWKPDRIKRPQVAQVCVDKHRGGPLGTVDLYFNSQITKFENLQQGQT
jgi:replicative DNA helicase